MVNKSIALLSGFLFTAAVALEPAWGANSPQPGTINYLEGQASIGGRMLSDRNPGAVRLDPGQTLQTQTGRAEILLTPGVFVRAADHSSVQMVSTGLADTVLAVQQGRVLIEVADIYPENNIVVNVAGTSTRLLKPGLYDFDALHPAVRVFDGKAEVRWNGHEKQLGGDRELLIGMANRGKTRKFDKASYEDDFYRWASLRSSYMMEANVDAAGRFLQQPGWGVWAGTGWYWDPLYDSYAFIPGDGVFLSPFGWGFYSPWAVWDAPYFGYWGGGYWGHHPRRFTPDYRPEARIARGFNGHAGHLSGSSVGGWGSRGFGGRGGFTGGVGAMRGGFHGGGGGFHGGGGGHR